MKKYLILDTNIIFNDFFFSDSEIRALSRLTSSLDLRFCMPKIVLAETVNKYKYLLGLEASKASTAASQINKRFRVLTEHKAIDIDEAVKSYEEFLAKMFGRPNLLLEYPSTAHEALSMRAVDRRKPFKDNGSGYRDALIWESILQLLAVGDQVYFVTGNSKDFFNGDDLHPDLCSDFSVRNIDQARFGIFPDIKSFFSCEVKPKLETISSLREQFLRNELEGIDTADLLRQVTNGVKNLDLGNLLPDNYDHSSYTIKYQTVSIGKIDDVWLLDDTDCYINYYYDATIDVEYFVDKNELHLKDEHEYEIEDPEWNDVVALVSTAIDVKIAASLVYDTEKAEEVQFDFELEP